MTVAKKDYKGVSLASLFVMALIAVASLSFTIGDHVGGESEVSLERMDLLAERVGTLEKLCERWDERWKNIEKWMIRIDSRIESLNNRLNYNPGEGVETSFETE